MSDETEGRGPAKASFFSRLFRRQPGAATQAPEESSSANSLAADERIYAIGDIHGRSDLLDAMWDRIRTDLREHPVARAQIVYLGDYVDRGRDSSGVIERLASPPRDLPPATAIMGNHDLVFRDLLAGQDVADLWRDFGGFETMRSYNVDPQPRAGRRWVDIVREQLLANMPRHHLEWLDGLALFLDRPPYFFCHAGVQPGVPLDRQDAGALMWIREEFLRSDADFGRIVVHGHTPVREPEIRRNRVNVDTGAFKTGILSCAVLEPGAIRILQARADGVS